MSKPTAIRKLLAKASTTAAVLAVSANIAQAEAPRALYAQSLKIVDVPVNQLDTTRLVASRLEAELRANPALGQKLQADPATYLRERGIQPDNKVLAALDQVNSDWCICTGCCCTGSIVIGIADELVNPVHQVHKLELPALRQP